mgnify:CR=1 FL=1
MLIKLPKTGPGVRYVETECSKYIKTIQATGVRESARDPVTIMVQICPEKGIITEIPCDCMEAAEALMDTIATLVNFPGERGIPLPAIDWSKQ